MPSESDFPRLANNPIVEAVFDIRARLDPGNEPEVIFQEAEERLKPEYPEKKIQFRQQHQIKKEQEQKPQVTVTEHIRGLQFVSEDKSQIVQFRRDGCTFNRLRPYGSFDDYLPEVQKLWRMYCDMANPVEVERVALRYINRIEVDLKDGQLDLDTYLRVAPKVPNADSVTVTGFLNQVQIRELQTQLKANVSTTIQDLKPGKVALVLDIDTFRHDRFEPSGEMIWDTMKALRGFKNRIFFGSITETCLGFLQ